VKTAENSDELIMALQLRYRVLYEEMLHRTRESRLDYDPLDLHCDHLLILDKASGICAGTYRLNSSLFHNRFYSQSEFKMPQILNLKGNKLELGRACVHPDYRNSLTLALLWKGINRYLRMSGSKYLFGCSSIQTMDLDQIIHAHFFFKRFHFAAHSLRVKPRRKYRIRALRQYDPLFPMLHDHFLENYRSSLPPLIKFYLKAGAVICGEPALDKHFQCIDFFTLLDTSRLDDHINRKYTHDLNKKNTA